MIDVRIQQKYRLNDIENVLFECENVIASAVEEQDIKEERKWITFLLYTFSKSITSAREIIVLCINGFPDGALSISRNIYEQLIVSLYLNIQRCNEETDKFNDILDRYFSDEEVQRLKSLKDIAKYRAEEVSEYDEKLDEIKDKFQLTTKFRDYWWTNNIISFRDLFEYVEKHMENIRSILIMLHAEYKRACISLHSSMLGNRLRLGSEYQGIDNGPWDNGFESSLFVASASMIQIIGMLFEELRINNDEYLSKLNGLAVYYCEMLKQCN